MPGPAPETDVAELAAMRREGRPVAVLDIREPWEVAICGLAGSLCIPMDEIAGRVGELPRDRPLVVLCHHGMRSLQVTLWLRSKGFESAVNLRGGIDAWARQIDPAMATY